MSWNLDTAHSEIQFAVRHLMISKVRGQFETFSGTINLDEATPSNSTIAVEIQVNSVNTRNEQRDQHLKSADFFDAESYPQITFANSKVEQTDEKHARVTGGLTIKGITKDVVLDVTYEGQQTNPFTGQATAGFNATTTINRKDWGIEWNQTLETGGIMVGDEIEINIEVELVKEGELAAVA